MQTFRVLHICDYAAAYRGNFIDSIESLEEYHDNVENFYLFPFYAKGTPAQKWIDEMNRNRNRAFYQERNFLKNFFLLSRIIKKNKINRIVRHFSDPKIDILIKLLFKGEHVIRFFHCTFSIEKNPLLHNFKKFIWRKNKLVGVSDSITDDIRHAYPTFSSYAIANAIHFDRLDVQEPFEKSDGVPLLIMGWDYMRKGVDLAIKACLPLQKKYNITLQIIGGKSEDKIKELARSIAGEDTNWIRYLPSINNVGTYFRANSIFLSPSRREAFGYANIEAVYCGNSVVLSKVDGQAQLHINGAYWFDSENVEAFTQALESAILEFNTPEKIAQREEAMQQVQHTYSLKSWSNKLVDLF